MLLNFVKEKINIYKELIKYNIHKTNNIIEFCLTPILNNEINLSCKERNELNRIIKKLELISSILNKILNELDKL